MASKKEDTLLTSSESIYKYIDTKLKNLKNVDGKLEVEIRVKDMNSFLFNKFYGYFYAVYDKDEAHYSVTYNKTLKLDGNKSETIRKEISINKNGITSSYLVKSKENKHSDYYITSIAVEKNTTEEEYDKVPGPVVIRKRERYPFILKLIKNGNKIKLCRIDLTKVTTSGGVTTLEDKKEPFKIREGVTYECEIEFTQTFLNNWKLMKDTFNKLMTRIEYLYINPYNFETKKDISPIDHRIISKPVNLKKEHLKSLFAYAITNKLDGQRKQIYFAGNGIFIYDSAGFIKYDDIDCKELYNTVLDAEFYKDSLYIFDEVRNDDTDFTERYQNMKKAQKILNKKSAKKYYVKDFTFCDIGTSISSVIREIIEESKNYKNDGLIFVPMYEKYSNRNTYKWKPPEELTIDFMLVKATQT